MSDFLRYGWPRWFLLRIHSRLPTSSMNDALLDFLYPDTCVVDFIDES